MPMLTGADVAALVDVAITAQNPTTLVIKRYNQNTNAMDTLPAQNVQVVYPRRQARPAGQPGVEEARADVTFYRAAPFDVYVGDNFDLDGHGGGEIRRVGTDPVLGLKFAEADFDPGVA